MIQKHFPADASKIAFGMDVIVIMISLFIARVVRSQFQDFVFALSTAIAVFSLMLFFRILALFLFDMYAISFRLFNTADVQRLFMVNLPSTLLMLVLRFASPFVSLRMPLSMIVIEYIATTLGFIVVRLILQSTLSKRTKPIGHIVRVVLWAEVEELKGSGIFLDGPEAKSKSVIVGIINSNMLYWKTEYKGIRVFGDESALNQLLADDDRISTICFHSFEDVTAGRMERILQLARELNLCLAVHTGDGMRIINEAEGRLLCLGKT